MNLISKPEKSARQLNFSISINGFVGCNFRRRSELIIKEAFLNDSGQYECRAKNKLARQPIRKFTRIDVLPKAQEYTSKYCYFYLITLNFNAFNSEQFCNDFRNI